MTAGKAPRTRRQLREALNTLNGSYQLLGNERDEAKSTAATLKRENTRLRADYAAAQSKLDSLGYEPSIERRLAADLGLVPPREEWQLKQGMTAHITPEEHAHIVDATVRDAVNGARRGVLTTVINALDIKGYARNVSLDTDRFWADLQTAIEVREEKRVADERERAEERVKSIVHPNWEADEAARQKAGQLITIDSSISAEKISAEKIFASAGLAPKLPANAIRRPTVGSSDGPAPNVDKTTAADEARAAIAEYLSAGAISVEDLRDIATIVGNTPRTVSTEKPAKKKSKEAE